MKALALFGGTCYYFGENETIQKKVVVFSIGFYFSLKMKRFKFKGGIYHEHFISVWWWDEFVNFGGSFEQGSPKQRSYLGS
ncbi:hypothetical protein EPJ63_00320 [Pediococcus acidilactici]|nr:hypothetical protein GBO58_06570 [Pediococcus acidilactici]KAF0382481.1 hypothetical protein GBO62_06485 [Pediococcus acidilactici]KAF0456314.1 hypothetical protein GBP02_06495 [Pediococcus acidilactici]KAF0475828.1 hypothetical protein GBP10_06780 [Pediococcus acidilactici]KAF0536109.1 hypothetical protein GBP37_06790 [Pediococcus acidilactici]